MTILTTKEIKELIETVIERHHLLRSITENLFGSKLNDEIWILFEAYCEQVALRIGDRYKWIEWFMYENDFGDCEFEARASDEHTLKKIKTVDDLVRLIEESR